MMASVQTFIIVPAAGTGARLGGAQPKQYLPLAGRLLIEHTLERLLALRAVAGIVIALHPDDRQWPTLPFANDARIRTVTGGQERCHSVLNALDALAVQAQPDDWVLVHDVARPCVRTDDIEQMREVLASHPVGGVLGVPASDTIKRVDATGAIVETVDRTALWHAQTPQMARYGVLYAALRTALQRGVMPTDEASALELAGHSPLMVEGHRENIKVTRREDLALAGFLLQHGAVP